MPDLYLPADTTLEAARVQNAVYQRMAPERRLALAFQMTASARALSEAGIRHRHPDYTDRQVRRALLRLTLGEELFRQVDPHCGDRGMTQDEFLVAIAEQLEAAGVPFMVAGSHGSSFHSQPRTTNDVDFVIDPTAEQLDCFLALLEGRCYVSPDAAREALARRSMFNVIDFDSGWKAVLIVRKDRPFSVEEMRRRQPRLLHGKTLPIATAEDVILTKLEWNRITPSERQLRDALNVAAAQWPTLDRDYLRKWAADLGVGETLEQVLQQAKNLQPE
jgi:hypothetical protein